METTLLGTWKSNVGDLISSIYEHLWVDESRLAAATRRIVGRLPGAAGQSLVRLFVDHCRQLDGWTRELKDQAWTVGIAVPCVGGVSDDVETADAVARSPRAIVAEALSLHDRLAKRLRDDLESIECSEAAGSISRLLNRLLEFHETTAWMLRLLLASPELVRVK